MNKIPILMLMLNNYNLINWSIKILVSACPRKKRENLLSNWK